MKNPEIQTEKKNYQESVAALRRAKEKGDLLSTRRRELEGALEDIGVKIARAREKAKDATRAWTAGDISQAEAKAAQRAISELEQEKRDNSSLLAALKEQAEEQKESIESLGISKESAEKTLYRLLEEAEIQRLHEIAAPLIKKAYVARLKNRPIAGFPKSLYEYIPKIFDGIHITVEEEAEIKQEIFRSIK